MPLSKYLFNIAFDLWARMVMTSSGTRATAIACSLPLWTDLHSCRAVDFLEPFQRYIGTSCRSDPIMTLELG